MKIFIVVFFIIGLLNEQPFQHYDEIERMPPLVTYEECIHAKINLEFLLKQEAIKIGVINAEVHSICVEQKNDSPDLFEASN